MINKIFQYDNVRNRVELNVPEILLVREFAELMKIERNKCKEDPKGTLGLRAFREFTYIWLAIDWSSVYSDYDEQERHQEALNDSGLTEEEFNNPEFRTACRKYRDLQESNRAIKMLRAAQTTADNFIDYFTTIVDMNERDANGKPVFTGKNVADEIAKLDQVYESLTIMEGRVKKQLAEQSSIRGGAVEGYTPRFKRS